MRAHGNSGIRARGGEWYSAARLPVARHAIRFSAFQVMGTAPVGLALVMGCCGPPQSALGNGKWQRVLIDAQPPPSRDEDAVTAKVRMRLTEALVEVRKGAE